MQLTQHTRSFSKDRVPSFRNPLKSQDVMAFACRTLQTLHVCRYTTLPSTRQDNGRPVPVLPHSTLHGTLTQTPRPNRYTTLNSLTRPTRMSSSRTKQADRHAVPEETLFANIDEDNDRKQQKTSSKDAVYSK